MQKVDIVYVEDNPKDALIVQRILKKEELTDSIVWLKDGEVAVKSLVEHEEYIPSLILLDVKLPKLTGLEVLKKIRNHAAINYVPIIMLSSSDEIIDIREAYRNGANGYTLKPQTYQETKEMLHSVVKFWLDRNKTIYDYQ